MLGPIRKFSSSIFAKVFLLIVAIPFVFWGMGDLFRGGELNTIARINDKKIPKQEFIYYLENYATLAQKINTDEIKKLLYSFIGEKLIALEIENFNIKISENSLSQIIKNEKLFERGQKFSRLEYEKFLLKNELNAIVFESNLSKQKKREQLFTLIGGGIKPSYFLINKAYDKINQKRYVEIIDLNEIFKKKVNFSEEQIKSYYEKNKKNYETIYKSIKFLKLNPKNLVGADDFSSLYFKKIDEIDDLIVEGKNLNYITKEFNIEETFSTSFDISGKNKKLKKIEIFPETLIKSVFNIENSEPTLLIEHKDNYFVIELTKTENFQNKIEDDFVKKDILLFLEKANKRKLITKIIDKINKNDFKKKDFYEFSKEKNINIKKIKIENLNDDKIIKKELVDQIYSFSEKRVVIVADVGLSESFLVYIDKIEHAFIKENSDNFKKYHDLSKVNLTSDLYNTYDTYLKNKYKIDINYKTLNSIKNNF